MLAVLAVYVLAVLLLCAGFYFAHLLDSVRQIARVARSAQATMTNARVDDLAKEKAVQGYALEMVKHAVGLIVKLLVVFLVASFPVWLATALGWIDWQTFAQFAVRMDVLLGTTIVLVIVAGISRKVRKTAP